MAGERPFGSWPSPITAARLVEGATAISELVVDGDDVWWAERRPSEAGRTAIARRRPDGEVDEVTPPDANVRTAVHEYGGGAWWAAAGTLYYVDHADQRLRSLEPGGTPVLLTPADGASYADGRPDIWVRELDGERSLVRVPLDGSQRLEIVASGADFYASPRVSPEGRVAWLQWNHPDMPWDGTELRVDGELIAGGAGESVFQPEWGPDGRLYYVSDRDGWWRLYDVDGALVCDEPGEVGVPHWVFGQSRYSVGDDGSIVAVVTRDGRDHLDLVPDATSVSALRSTGRGVALVAGSQQHDRQVLAVAPDGTRTVLRAPRRLGLDAQLFPDPEPITFPTTGDAVAHGLFYAPANPDWTGPSGERPPLLVLVHGGPTSMARNELSLELRYWTSRGFAVVDVNYRGSTGYGRAYRRQLDGQWGVADVDDCIAAARFLADRGDVDGDRLAIRGGSAGGFTVLAALAFHDVFAVGASRYGVGDIAALGQETHDFESHYFERLVGPYPEALDVYRARSPVFHADGIRRPVILLQGLEDKVVPPSQSEAMVERLEANGVEHQYVTFADEGHGFRRAENIVAALQAELDFFGRVLGFEPVH